MDYDFAIVGAGIIGLATARELADRHRRARILVIEKEQRPACHQTGHNSGVIHAGVYYQPGSLKARLCREGAAATKQFCRETRIPFATCGKLLVATSPVELERMQALEKRAGENGIELERVSKAMLRRIEPRIAGLGALFVPATGIVDYGLVSRAMAAKLPEERAHVRFGTRLGGIDEDGASVVVRFTGGARVRCRYLIACAGLQSDRVARMGGLAIDHRIVPFRGEYYTLPPAKSDIVKHLIYPIPDPDLPFLGIHLTRMINGSVTVGPNAVLGFDREGYRKGSFNLRDAMEMVQFKGFWKMAADNLRAGAIEFRNSLLRSRYLEECRKYCPSLTLDDLQAPAAGIRAQAVLSDGSLVHDFLFSETSRQLHVCNAPSPAATSAIPIAGMIVDRLEERLA